MTQPPANPVADQLAAATAEAGLIQQRFLDILRVVAPDRHWFPKASKAGGDVDRLLLATLDTCQPCRHLRRGGPQPVLVRLRQHRYCCDRCIGIVRRPPAGEEDRCDWCGARGVEVFTPLTVHRGPFVFLGEACSGCTELLVGPRS